MSRRMKFKRKDIVRTGSSFSTHMIFDNPMFVLHDSFISVTFNKLSHSEVSYYLSKYLSLAMDIQVEFSHSRPSNHPITKVSMTEIGIWNLANETAMKLNRPEEFVSPDIFWCGRKKINLRRDTSNIVSLSGYNMEDDDMIPESHNPWYVSVEKENPDGSKRISPTLLNRDFKSVIKVAQEFYEGS